MSQTQRFDQEAATWDENPRRVSLAKGVAEAIVREMTLSPAMAVLDFGCGTGLLTLNLRSRVGTITGADTSHGMLEVLGRKVREQRLTGVESFQLRPEDGYALRGTYDLIVSSMTLHHVRDLAPLFRQFREHLRPGGQVALADLDAEDGTFHDQTDDVFHLGFDRSQVLDLLQAAGFEGTRATTAHEIRRNGRDYPVFLATARRRS